MRSITGSGTGRGSGLGRAVYRIAGAPHSPSQRALAAVFAAGDDALLSHSSAAALFELPGFTIEPLTVTVSQRRSTEDGRGPVRGVARCPAHHRRVVDRIPCTSMARTLFDLCGDREVHPRRAERALDTAIARKMVTMPALWRVLDDLAEHGRRGTVWMRTLLMERGGRYVPPESELEARFVELVHRFRLERPDRQVDLGDADSWIGRVDFVWRQQRLVVEVDGSLHHDGFLDRQADRAARRPPYCSRMDRSPLPLGGRRRYARRVADTIRCELNASPGHGKLTPRRTSGLGEADGFQHGGGDAGVAGARASRPSRC